MCLYLWCEGNNIPNIQILPCINKHRRQPKLLDHAVKAGLVFVNDNDVAAGVGRGGEQSNRAEAVMCSISVRV